MSVRILFPKNKLGELMRAPGGMKADEALKAADANLLELKEPLLAELRTALEEIHAGFAAYGPVYDDAKLDGLYAISSRTVGMAGLCGLPAIDEAVTSLCDLLDHLKHQRQWDAEAVGVHIHSLRILLTANPGDSQVAAILSGLRKVSRRYAAT